MDRRNKPPSPQGPVYMNCRLCWERIELKADRIEPLEAGRYAYHCQHCENSYLLRSDDVIALGLHDRGDDESE
jgi:hypothetical protein